MHPDDDTRAPRQDGAPRPPYLSAGTRALWAKVALGAAACSSLLSVAAYANEISVVRRLRDGGNVPIEEVETSDALVALASLLFLATLLFAIVAFAFWMHRVYANLAALGAEELRFTPAWAVGWYFVPFMNLVRPYQAMLETWKASDPSDDLAQSSTAWRRSAGSTLAKWWWGAWLLAGIIGPSLTSAWSEPADWDAWIMRDYQEIAAAAGLAVAAVLAIALVGRVTARQDRAVRRTHGRRRTTFAAVR